MNFSRKITVATLIALNTAFTVACSRENKVYSDPEEPRLASALTELPEDFRDHSVGRASVEIQTESTTSDARALRFQTETGSNPIGGFNGSGIGSSAILGLESWNSRPVTQAEPLTFDAKNHIGSLKINASLQIDLECDGADIRVVQATGAAIESQTPVALDGGYSRFTASIAAPIWLSRSQAILDPTTSDTLLADSGAPTSLQALLTRFPAACLKTAATQALELPRGLSTSGVLWSLGDDSTVTANVVFVRRLTVGNETYENLQ